MTKAEVELLGSSTSAFSVTCVLPAVDRGAFVHSGFWRVFGAERRRDRGGMNRPRVVLFTRVPSLIDHCAALADGIGLGLDIRLPENGGWQDAALVLIGDDITEAPDVGNVPTVLVTLTQSNAVWATAARLGADTVAVLPAGAEWLTIRMINAVEPPAEPAQTWGFVGGVGGAGTSVLACAVARSAAAQDIDTVLLDADPLGGGLDLVLGAEGKDGLRWPSLAASRGRLRPSTLRDSLPRTEGLAVLSWDRTGTEELTPEVFEAVMTAAQQAFELVVVDLPRHAPVQWARMCSELTVVVPGRVRAAVAASRVARRLEAVNSAVRIAVRDAGRGGVRPELVADTIGLPLVGVIKDDPQAAAAVDRGEGLPIARTHVGRVAEKIVEGGSL